jgi:hypothetical protein
MESKKEMASPTEGEVMEINYELLQNPSDLRQDPYGKGWLVAVHVPDEENTTRNCSPKAWCMSGCRMRRSGCTRGNRRSSGCHGGWRAPGGRPAGECSGCQLGRGDRGVLSHGLGTTAVSFCYPFD